MYDSPRFAARVAHDGAVTFDDNHIGVEAYVFGVPLRSLRPEQGQRRASLFSAIKQALRGGIDDEIAFDPTLCGLTGPRGAGPCRSVAPLTVVGTFDLTDEVMNWLGEGWYRYEKAKFLSATFEFRTQLALAHRRKLLEAAVKDLPSRLDELWADTRSPEIERRRIVCLLWSEVDLSTGESAAAARQIESWIRTRLPAKSGRAYSAREIAACPANGALSFSPYEGL